LAQHSAKTGWRRARARISFATIEIRRNHHAFEGCDKVAGFESMAARAGVLP
jgi:hypothetical protein